jgi:hypothetical protein
MIAVRILRDGQVVREVVLPTLPARIGRGAENEVVLFDESVSRVHAVVEAEPGGAVVRDLGSRNGLILGGARVDNAPIWGATRLYLGNVEIELQAASGDATVPISRADWVNQRRTFKDHARYVLVGCLAVLAQTLSETEFWSPWQHNRSGELLGDLLTAILAQPLLGFFLLMLLRAVSRRVRIADTLRAIAIVLWLLPVLSWSSTGLYYVLPLPLYAPAVEALEAAVGIVFIVYLAGVRRTQPKGRFQLAWAGAVAAFILSSKLVEHMNERRAGQPVTAYHVQMPIGSWAGWSGKWDDYLAHLRQGAGEAGAEAERVRQRLDKP